MTDNENPADDAAWAAERRQFVADDRDRVAGDRERVADQRDVVADRREDDANARQAAFDAFELALDERAAQLDMAPLRTDSARAEAAELRAAAERVRVAASDTRRREESEREAASGRRAEADARRELQSSTMLATAFAELAQHLHQAADFDDVVNRVVALTVLAVEGSDMASVTLREHATFSTAASTADAAIEIDHAQYETGEGPCVDAVDQSLVYAPRFPDARWPRLDDRPTRSGVESIVSFQLSSNAHDPKVAVAGSLNVYANKADAFDLDAQQIGLVLAAHASVAAGAAREREALQQISAQLRDALASRDVIGQAKGVLMERLGLSPEDAFDVLRHTSQQLNLKLREVATRLTESGELPGAQREP